MIKYARDIAVAVPNFDKHEQSSWSESESRKRSTYF